MISKTRLYREVSNRLDMPYNTVRYALEHAFHAQKREMREWNYNGEILFRGFWHLTLDRVVIRAELWTLLERIRKSQALGLPNYVSEKAVKQFKHLWAAKQKIIKHEFKKQEIRRKASRRAKDSYTKAKSLHGRS